VIVGPLEADGRWRWFVPSLSHPGYHALVEWVTHEHGAFALRCSCDHGQAIRRKGTQRYPDPYACRHMRAVADLERGRRGDR
jgi:hypothetical protein